MPRDEDARPALTLDRSTTRQARRLRRVAIAGAALLLLAATGPGAARVATAALPLEYNLAAPGLQQSVGGILPVGAGGLYVGTLLYLTAAVAIEGFGDPSLCYRLEVTRPVGADFGDVFFDVDLPIAPLQANAVSATLSIELVDTNGDGMASLTHRAGFTEFQRGFLVQGPNGTSLGVHLGIPDLTAPGLYEFEAGISTPIAGPTTSEAATTSLVTTFILSPGDTVLVRGKIVQDDGSGAPVCEIPGPPSITGCSHPDAILGTPDGDILDGTPGDDVICGGDGNDRIDGRGGDDRIFGGPGRDFIAGGAGRDIVYGEAGDDVICGDLFVGAPDKSVGTDAAACVGDASGSSYDDRIDGGTGKDFIGGGPGPDVIRGGPDNDRLAGGPGRDRLLGEEGNDRLAGGAGKDVLRGDDGADELRGEGGHDDLRADDGAADALVDGGPGNDTAVIDPGVDVTVVGVETVLP